MQNIYALICQLKSRINQLSTQVNNGSGSTGTLQQVTDTGSNTTTSFSQTGQFGTISQINNTNSNIFSLIGNNSQSGILSLGNTAGERVTLKATNISAFTELELPNIQRESIPTMLATSINNVFADNTGNINVVKVTDNYADDTAAGVGGIAVGSLYHTNGIVKIKLS